MPLPTVILFTAALLAAMLAAIGWWQDPAAPGLGAWFVAKLTEGGLWTGLLLFLVAACYLTWRGRRAEAADAPPRRDDPEG